ncbi:MAG: hypothetical protein DRN24_07080 [Thermoplasmata archaeon]|nr:MAG: hypothetical protein DRN24_07080 [Thermoplasmata archaeon]
MKKLYEFGLDDLHKYRKNIRRSAIVGLGCFVFWSCSFFFSFYFQNLHILIFSGVLVVISFIFYVNMLMLNVVVGLYINFLNHFKPR